MVETEMESAVVKVDQAVVKVESAVVKVNQAVALNQAVTLNRVVEPSRDQNHHRRHHHMMKQKGQSGNRCLQFAAAADHAPNDRQDLMHIDSDEADGVCHLFS
ncbi:MAG: hypothetical protein OXF47_03890 [Nitrospira sp.]|nr:hypothetical protein [Nitrospira sp.]